MGAMSLEPARLTEGKDFHNEVARDFVRTSAEGTVRYDRPINLVSQRVGRPDIWIAFTYDEVGADRTVEGGVEVVEVKNTNWDAVATSKLRRYILDQSRQLWKYLLVALDSRQFAAGATVLFPRKPVSLLRQRVIEVLFAERGIKVHWYRDSETVPLELLDAYEADAPGPADILLRYRYLLGQEVEPGGDLPAWATAACRGRSPAALGRRTDPADP
jgi:hypothetical protein